MECSIRLDLLQYRKLWRYRSAKGGGRWQVSSGYVLHDPDFGVHWHLVFIGGCCDANAVDQRKDIRLQMVLRSSRIQCREHSLAWLLRKFRRASAAGKLEKLEVRLYSAYLSPMYAVIDLHGGRRNLFCWTQQTLELAFPLVCSS